MPLRQQDDSQRCAECGRKIRVGRANPITYIRPSIGHAPGCLNRGLPFASAVYQRKPSR